MKSVKKKIILMTKKRGFIGLGDVSYLFGSQEEASNFLRKMLEEEILELRPGGGLQLSKKHLTKKNYWRDITNNFSPVGKKKNEKQ